MVDERPPGRGPAQPGGARPASIGNDPTAIPAGQDVDAMHGDPEVHPESEQAQFPGTEAQRSERNVAPADALVGTHVSGPGGTQVGKVCRVLVDLVSGDLAFVVLELEGIARGKLCAVPWPAVSLEPETHALHLAMTPDDLRQAPTFDADNWPDTGDPAWLEEVHVFFRCRPYWRPAASDPNTSSAR